MPPHPSLYRGGCEGRLQGVGGGGPERRTSRDRRTGAGSLGARPFFLGPPAQPLGALFRAKKGSGGGCVCVCVHLKVVGGGCFIAHV